jgi:ankyrin repeat protein
MFISNLNNHLNNGGDNTNNGNALSDLTLNELQEMVLRQQQQIEVNQQLLNAKEKRLRQLKIEEDAQQRQYILQQQQQQQQHVNHHKLKPNNKLDTLKQNVIGQEAKIFKLKQLRKKLIEHKLSDSNMYSEVELIKLLLSNKENELYEASSKVNEIKKQIEQLRKIKTINPNNNNAITISSNNEIDKLKQELHIRNKLNEQQAKKIKQQHDEYSRKQQEVYALDLRIEEFQRRIANKMNRQTLKESSLQQQKPKEISKKHFEIEINNKTQQQQQQQQITAVSSPSKLIPQQTTTAKFATKQEIANTYMNKYNGSNDHVYQRYHQINTSNQNNKPTFQNNDTEAATKVINNNSNQNETSTNGLSLSTASLSSSTSNSSADRSASPSQQPNLIKQASNHLKPSNETSSSTSSPSPSPTKTSDNKTEDVDDFLLSNQKLGLTKQEHTLPSHLRLEFDKLKYLPDMIKTIKKRHSISEVEGSLHTVAPQIFQRVLDQTNFIQNQNETSKKLTPPPQPLPPQSQSQGPKLNQIKEIAESFTSNENENENEFKNEPLIVKKEEKEEQVTTSNEPIVIITSSSSSSKTFLLSSPTANEIINTTTTTNTTNNKQNIIQKSSSSSLISDNIKESQLNNKIETITSKTGSALSILNDEDHQKQQQKQPIITKSIIKKIPQAHLAPASHNKRVNFDPHALLLDAAVEGELDLVIRCAKQVHDVSLPNDEGITALHNSVCAGHFEIVQFLVQFGCDVNFADNDGWTPLHCAASCNNAPMVKFLIEHGASVFATTISDNETAIRKCEEDEEGYLECIEYLKQTQDSLGTDNVYNNTFVYSLYDYKAQHEDELDLIMNEKYVIIDKYEKENDLNDGWWLARPFNETMDQMKVKAGLVPKNYLGVSVFFYFIIGDQLYFIFKFLLKLYPRKNQQESTSC